MAIAYDPYTALQQTILDREIQKRAVTGQSLPIQELEGITAAGLARASEAKAREQQIATEKSRFEETLAFQKSQQRLATALGYTQVGLETAKLAATPGILTSTPAKFNMATGDVTPETPGIIPRLFGAGTTTPGTTPALTTAAGTLTPAGIEAGTTVAESATAGAGAFEAGGSSLGAGTSAASGGTAAASAGASAYLGVAGTSFAAGTFGEKAPDIVPMPKQPAAKGAIKGAGAGAATGAAIGSIYPGIGTGIGAIIGTIFGAIGGGLSGSKEPKIQTKSPLTARRSSIALPAAVSGGQKSAYGG